jgi:hypothetical protein
LVCLLCRQSSRCGNSLSNRITSVFPPYPYFAQFHVTPLSSTECLTYPLPRTPPPHFVQFHLTAPNLFLPLIITRHLLNQSPLITPPSSINLPHLAQLHYAALSPIPRLTPTPRLTPHPVLICCRPAEHQGRGLPLARLRRRRCSPRDQVQARGIMLMTIAPSRVPRTRPLPHTLLTRLFLFFPNDDSPLA